MERDQQLIDKNVKTKNGNGIASYWRFVLLLTILLLLLLKFPLVINVYEKFYDTLFYGVISTGCLALAIRLYQRFRKRAYLLITVVFLCAGLSAWHIIDLHILRLDQQIIDWGPDSGFVGEDMTGWAMYSLRFPAVDIEGCGRSMLSEHYRGHPLLAITVERDWNAVWIAC